MDCLENFYKIDCKEYFLASVIHMPVIERPPIIVMFHGFTGHKVENRRLYVDIARDLCNNGFAVLRFDYRGHGDSPFLFEEFKLDWALEDAEHVLNYVLRDLRDKVNVDRIGLIGLSLGGAVSIYIASKYAVKSMILLSPAIDFSRIGADSLKNMAGKIGLKYIYFGPLRIRTKNMLEMRKFNGFKFLEKIKASTLIIHSKDDKVVPYSLSQEFYEKLNVEKKLILLDEGGHVFETWGSRKRVKKEIMEWFKEKLC